MKRACRRTSQRAVSALARRSFAPFRAPAPSLRMTVGGVGSFGCLSSASRADAHNAKPPTATMLFRGVLSFGVALPGRELIRPCEGSCGVKGRTWARVGIRTRATNSDREAERRGRISTRLLAMRLLTFRIYTGVDATPGRLDHEELAGNRAAGQHLRSPRHEKPGRFWERRQRGERWRRRFVGCPV